MAHSRCHADSLLKLRCIMQSRVHMMPCSLCPSMGMSVVVQALQKMMQ